MNTTIEKSEVYLVKVCVTYLVKVKATSQVEAESKIMGSSSSMVMRELDSIRGSILDIECMRKP